MAASTKAGPSGIRVTIPIPDAAMLKLPVLGSFLAFSIPPGAGKVLIVAGGTWCRRPKKLQEFRGPVVASSW
jgi:hypothetical protein